ncbi:MAG: hypothetical protein ABIT71_12340 [Vicinamibacteraceae bacterium]
MTRSSAASLSVSRRIGLMAAVLAAIAVAGGPVRASSTSDAVTVEPRIVEARLGRVSLEQVDVSLRVALRASRDARIRSLAFTDAFVGQMPVWIARIDGDWPLTSGQELVIPQLMQVRLNARDAVGVDDLGAIVRRGSVTVRASVEVAIATPWVSRLFFMGPTRILVRDVSLEMPIALGSSKVGSLTRMGADLVDAAQRGAVTWLASGLNRLPARSATVLRFGGAVASVTSRYDIEGTGAAGTRERRAAGVWWSPTVFCTTREALEPWRYDVGDATALQLRGARLGLGRRTAHVAATRDRPAVDIDLAAFAALLPAPSDRKLYTLVDGQPRRLRLADRDAASNLVCLQVGGTPATSGELALAGVSAGTSPAAPRAGASTDVAAFSPGRSLAIVWTSVTSTGADRLQIATPLHRASFGSPLVAGDRLVGLVASPMTAWPASLVASAAARALLLPASSPASPGPPASSAR